MNEKNPIQSVTVIQQHSSSNLPYRFTVGVAGVKEIRNCSEEYENGVFVMYRVLGEDEKLIAELINCPVMVKYDKY